MARLADAFYCIILKTHTIFFKYKNDEKSVNRCF